MRNQSTDLIERTLRINSNPVSWSYDAFITTDHNLIIQEVNEATLKVLGYNSRQLIGSSIEGILKENALSVYMKFLNSSPEFQFSEDSEQQVNLFCNSGKTVRASLFVTILPESVEDHHIWLFKSEEKERTGNLLGFLSKNKTAKGTDQQSQSN